MQALSQLSYSPISRTWRILGAPPSSVNNNFERAEVFLALGTTTYHRRMVTPPPRGDAGHKHRPCPALRQSTPRASPTPWLPSSTRHRATRVRCAGGSASDPGRERKGVGEGKSVSVRVDLGGRRIIKK